MVFSESGKTGKHLSIYTSNSGLHARSFSLTSSTFPARLLVWAMYCRIFLLAYIDKGNGCFQCIIFGPSMLFVLCRYIAVVQ